MSSFYSLITTIGRARIANALALQQTITLTEMSVGDGNGSAVVPTEAMTALSNEVYRAAISQLSIDPANPDQLVAEMVIPMDQGGFTVREAGVWDDQGNLIAIANFPETYKPIVAEGSGRELTVRIFLQVESAEAVDLVIDPTVIFASRAWVNSRLNWQIVDTPGALAVSQKHFITAAGTYTLPTPGSVKSGESIIVASAPGIEPVIDVSGGSQINTDKGADTEVIVNGDIQAEFVMTGTQWEV